MSRYFILFCVILGLTGCQSNDAPRMIFDGELSETAGNYCEVYSPEGQVLYQSDWSGVMPAVEAFEGDYRTATFGMGCFWGPAAEFAILEGVLRTRVGYSGGTLTTPTYEELGNHIEVFEVDYDPTTISYESLVRYYFDTFDTTERPFSRRVHTVIYYRSQAERRAAEAVKREVEQSLNRAVYTEIDAFDRFYLAEEKHQLSYLKMEISLYEELSQIFPEHDQQLLSILASRLNGHIAGYGTEETLSELLEKSSLSVVSRDRMWDVFEAR